MKTVIKFKDTPEDIIALNRHMKSLDMALALFDISNAKKQCMHIADYQDSDSDVEDGVYITFNKIFEIFEKYSINLDEILE